MPRRYDKVAEKTPFVNIIYMTVYFFDTKLIYVNHNVLTHIYITTLARIWHIIQSNYITSLNGMNKAIITIIVSIFLTLHYIPLSAEARAQNVLSLDECMRYAVVHNTSVKNQEITNENYKLDRIGAIADMLPIAASTSANLGYKHSIDPTTDAFITDGDFGNNYGISASIPIFNGFSTIHNVKISKIRQLMGADRSSQIKDDVALSTMRAYIDVIYSLNMIDRAEEQLKVSFETLRRSKKLLELGRISVADLAQIESQYTGYDLLVLQQQNRLELALLSLKDRMNYPIEEELSVETQDLLDNITIKALEESEITNYALQNNYQILNYNNNLKISKLHHKTEVARLFPTISLRGGYSTNFYKSVTSDNQYNSFHTQLRDNSAYSLGLSIGVPIFSGLSKQLNIRKSKNNLRIKEQEGKDIQRSIHIEIQKMLIGKRGAEKELVKAQQSVEAASLAHRASIRKFEEGLISALDMQITANTLLSAESNKLRVKLDYIINSRLIEYYGGTPLIRD